VCSQPNWAANLQLPQDYTTMNGRRLLTVSTVAALVGSLASALHLRRRRPPDEREDAAVTALRARMERARADLLRRR
jgi:hypothetical protein